MHVGITGHRTLHQLETWVWVEAVLRDQIASFVPPVIGITSLAAGTDQLFARLVLEAGGQIHAVVPFPDMERSLPPDSVETYHELLHQATTVETLARHGTDQDAYLRAGHRVVNLSQLMVAVWDGAPARGRGGTAEVVEYTRRKHMPLVHVDPVRFKVVQPVLE